MKNLTNLLVLMLFSSSLIFTACGPAEEDRDKADEESDRKAEAIIDEIEKEEAKAEREERIGAYLDRLDELTMEMEEVKEEKSEEAKERYKELKSELKSTRESLSDKLSELKEDGDEAFNDLVNEIEKSIEKADKAMGDREKKDKEDGEY